MFPAKEKSALMKKNMQMWKEVVGQDKDSDKLLNIALTIPTTRVVLKRSVYAYFLTEIQLCTSINTKSHRFYKYLIECIDFRAHGYKSLSCLIFS